MMNRQTATATATGRRAYSFTVNPRDRPAPAPAPAPAPRFEPGPEEYEDYDDRDCDDQKQYQEQYQDQEQDPEVAEEDEVNGLAPARRSFSAKPRPAPNPRDSKWAGRKLVKVQKSQAPPPVPRGESVLDEAMDAYYAFGAKYFIAPFRDMLQERFEAGNYDLPEITEFFDHLSMMPSEATLRTIPGKEGIDCSYIFRSGHNEGGYCKKPCEAGSIYCSKHSGSKATTTKTPAKRASKTQTSHEVVSKLGSYSTRWNRTNAATVDEEPPTREFQAPMRRGGASPANGASRPAPRPGAVRTLGASRSSSFSSRQPAHAGLGRKGVAQRQREGVTLHKTEEGEFIDEATGFRIKRHPNNVLECIGREDPDGLIPVDQFTNEERQLAIDNCFSLSETSSVLSPEQPPEVIEEEGDDSIAPPPASHPPTNRPRPVPIPRHNRTGATPMRGGSTRTFSARRVPTDNPTNLSANGSNRRPWDEGAQSTQPQESEPEPELVEEHAPTPEEEPKPSLDASISDDYDPQPEDAEGVEPLPDAADV